MVGGGVTASVHHHRCAFVCNSSICNSSSSNSSPQESGCTAHGCLPSSSTGRFYRG